MLQSPKNVKMENYSGVVSQRAALPASPDPVPWYKGTRPSTGLEHIESHAPDFDGLSFDPVMSMLWAIKGATTDKFTRVPGRAFKNGRPFMVAQESRRYMNRIIVILLIGILTGSVAFLIGKGCSFLTGNRLKIMQSLYESSPVGGLIFLIIWNAVLVGCSSCMVIYIAPGAKGSGIPQAKSYLNGVNVPKVFDFDTMIVTIVGTILGVASGLCVGPEVI